MRKSVLVVLLLSALALPASSQVGGFDTPGPRIDVRSPTPAARPARPAPPPTPTPSFADVQIAHIDDLGKPMDLKADVWTPATRGAPTPLLLYIHGKGGSYKVRGDRMALMAINLTQKGFAVATIDYRLSGRMPAMLMDTKAYVRYFRAHARDYNIDPDRVAIWGVSRGGNLAAMLAVTGDVKALEGDVGGNTDFSSKLNASVIESPLTDMFANTDDKAASMFGDYLGTSEAESKAIVAAYRKHDTASPAWAGVEKIEAANPVNYITKDSPPALIICAGGDTGNVIANCTVMFDKYIQVAADAQYYAWAQGAHVQVGPHIEDASVAWLMDKLKMKAAVGAQVTARAN
jgi:acetyl esterase/lipase